ncbi:MAG TPA: gas vesicle protein [Isosphaeraceae bacterium]
MSIQPSRTANHSIHSATLADVLERVLDKGLVIAGDIKIKLVDIELLTIQIRLVVCSVEKARELGMDWWTTNSAFRSQVEPPAEMAALHQRIALLEERLAATGPALVGQAVAPA